MPCRKATAARVAGVVEGEWGDDLIRSWTKHSWIDLPLRIGDKIARLIGAQAGRSRRCGFDLDQSLQDHGPALRPRPNRRVILSETGNFPTDLYVAQGLIELLGGRHELRLVAPEALAAAIDEYVALVSRRMSIIAAAWCVSSRADTARS